MNYFSGVFLCCVLTIASNQGTFADVEDKSTEDMEAKQQNENSTLSLETGPPDSHEAMNNRELNAKAIRDKRSYEFLMGLVNNNSKFEITKIDPINNKSSSQKESNPSSSAASELLLELLVKIAAHPDHWNKVHNLLERIDNDLMASKKIVDEMTNSQIKIEPKIISSSRTEPASIAVKKKENKHHLERNEWPSFDDFETDLINNNNNIGFVNTAAPSSDEYRYQHNNNKQPAIYPKTFAYQRVTGRPMYLNKNPKAYIAVSVIAPKPIINTRSKNNGGGGVGEDDLSLEKELRQLKPWTHNENLKNMASIRSRWVIDDDERPMMVLRFHIKYVV